MEGAGSTSANTSGVKAAQANAGAEGAGSERRAAGAPCMRRDTYPLKCAARGGRPLDAGAVVN